MYYQIALEPDDNDTLLVTCAALPEVTSFGDSEEDARRHAQDAISAALAGRVQRRQDIPAPLDGPGPDRVMVPPTLAAKVALYRVLRESGVSQTDLAGRLGKDAKQVQRLLDPAHRSAPEDLAAALATLGWRMEVSFRPAA